MWSRRALLVLLALGLAGLSWKLSRITGARRVSVAPIAADQPQAAPIERVESGEISEQIRQAVADPHLPEVIVKSPGVVDCDLTFIANFVRAEDGGALTGGEVLRLSEEEDGDETFVFPGAACAALDSAGTLRLCIGSREASFRFVRSPGRSQAIVSVDSRRARVIPPPSFALDRSATLVLHIIERVPSHPDYRAVVFKCPAQQLLAREQPIGAALSWGTLLWRARVDTNTDPRLEDLPVRVPIELSLEMSTLRKYSLVYLHPEALIFDPGEVRELTLDVGTLAQLVVNVVDEREQPVPARELGLTQDDIAGRAGQERALLPSNDKPHFKMQGRTDEHGQWTCADVPPGVWWIGLVPTREPWEELDAGAVAPIAQRVEIAAYEAGHELTLRTTRGLYLTGRVETPDGQLFAPGATLGASPNVILFARSVELGSTTTGQPELDGNFAIGPLLAGEYEITTFARNYAPVEPLHVRTGGGPIVIRMQLGASLSGHVVDATTSAPVQCDFVMTCLAGYVPEMLGSTDGQGTFGFAGLAPGEYVVSAFAPDGRTGTTARQRLEAGAGANDITLRLEPADACGQVRIVLEGAVVPGRISLWQDGVCRSLLFVDGAMVQTVAAPPGDLEARLFAGQDLVERRALNVVHGSTTELRIRR